jgi:hypothetical protein
MLAHQTMVLRGRVVTVKALNLRLDPVRLRKHRPSRLRHRL